MSSGASANDQSALKTIGVVGAGVMGCGLAEALIGTGHDVVLVDNDPGRLDQARSAVRRSLLSQSLLEKRPGGPGLKDIHRLTLTTDLAALGPAHFVVENITELWADKAELYPALDAACGRDTVFAANTSTLPIARLGELTQRPERVIGMHFMNPVPQKPMVEVIMSKITSRQTLDVAAQLLEQMGKEMILVGDAPGFVSNRVLMLTINEAIAVVAEGTAEAETVDRLFCGCFGHAMGPLATADLIGLDTILLSLRSLRELRDDRKFEPVPLLEELVAAGRLGRKSGRGFHTYRARGAE